MCCISNPRALGLPSPSDGLLSFNSGGTEGGEEGTEPHSEIAPEAGNSPWKWDAANVDLPDSQTQIAGFDNVAFASDSFPPGDYDSDNGQYPYLIDEWATLG